MKNNQIGNKNYFIDSYMKHSKDLIKVLINDGEKISSWETLIKIIDSFKKSAIKIFDAAKGGDQKVLSDVQLLLKQEDLDHTHLKLKDIYNAIAIRYGCENWVSFKGLIVSYSGLSGGLEGLNKYKNKNKIP